MSSNMDRLPWDRLQCLIDEKKSVFQTEFSVLEKLMDKLDVYIKRSSASFPKKSDDLKSISTGSTNSIQANQLLQMMDPPPSLVHQPTIKEVRDDESDNTPTEGDRKVLTLGLSEQSPEHRRSISYRARRKVSAESGSNRTKDPQTPILDKHTSALTPTHNGKEPSRFSQIELDRALLPEHLIEYVDSLRNMDQATFYREILIYIINTQNEHPMPIYDPAEIETSKKDFKTILKVTPRAYINSLFKKDVDINLRNIIILTYDNYTNAYSLLLFLFMKLYEPVPLNLTVRELKEHQLNSTRFVKQRVLSMLYYWFKERIEDFINEPKLLTLMKVVLDVGGANETDPAIKKEIAAYSKIYQDKIEKFITGRNVRGNYLMHNGRAMEDEEMTRETSPRSSSKTNEKRKKTEEDKNKPSSLISLFSSLFTGNSIKSSPFWRYIMDSSAMTIAEHCRTVNFEVFQSIPILECFQSRWDKTQVRRKQAPQMGKLFMRTNNLAFWVSISIARQPDLTYAIMVIQKMMEIAEKSKEIQDYETCFQIYNRINQLGFLPCSKKIWGEIPWAIKVKLREFERLFDNQNNYARFHDHFLASSPPCLPVFNYFLMKLRNLQTAPAYLTSLNGKKYINYQSQKALGDFLTKIRNFQGAKVECKEYNKHLYQYLARDFIDELASYQIDTVDFSNADECIQRLLDKINSTLN